MVSKTFSILFFLRRLRGDGKDHQHIYLRITVDEKRAELSVKRTWDPKKWNPHTGRAMGNKEEARSLNSYLETLQAKIYEAYTFLLQVGEAITAEKIKNRLLGKAQKPKMILEIFGHHNEQMKALVGHSYAPLTYKRYQTTLDHAKAFIDLEYKAGDLPITQLNYDFISEFEFYLKSVRHCGHNTAMKYLTNFKKIVLLCVKKGWLQKDPFYGFKLAGKVVNRDFLSQQELDAIQAKEFSAPRLAITRDLFLFSCYTGLAYVDVFKLKRSEIAKGVDGEQWVFTSRKKTDGPSRIPLLPVCLQIIEKYKDHPKCVNQDKVLPAWSNQKVNEYLKEIADVCGIGKRLTYHVARHTFATTVTLNNGVPIETVSKMLGHKNLRMTQHYAKLLDQKVSEDMKQLRNKLNIKTDRE